MSLRRLLLRYYPPGAERGGREGSLPCQGLCRLGGAGAGRGDCRWACGGRPCQGGAGGVCVGGSPVMEVFLTSVMGEGRRERVGRCFGTAVGGETSSREQLTAHRGCN